VRLEHWSISCWYVSLLPLKIRLAMLRIVVQVARRVAQMSELPKLFIFSSGSWSAAKIARRPA
jgi:hypothetical protein